MAAARSDTGYDPFLDQFSDPFLCLGHYPAFTGRSQYAAVESGLIDQPLQMLYNDMAVMLGMVYALLPFMVLPIYVSIEQLDTRLLEAASDLGAKPLTAFRKVTLPLTMPGIAAGTILVFISSLGMFVVPDVMGGAKSALIGNLIQNQFLSARDWPFGSALSIVLAVLSLVLIILYYKALQAQEGGDGDAKDVA